ncbi:Fic family protein [Paenibacillus sp. IB182496]|uniref:Fic family protein n=1 Tax=Paenibacillus sabuli TaxID=2772509 RepID=A0A927GSW3_9BACL|nr:Fic/DOC family N-terminal domain-containing protein [Paenibacillus sabuli]MBD2847184.1 Fic family protein [Paenibacillus sabuli]
MKKTPFIPDRLPLQSDQLNQLFFLKELIEANKKIAQYQVLLQNTKLPSHLLLNPVMLNEAVQSTKIEGTQVTLDEVLEVETKSRKNNKDVQEVVNYYQALREGMDKLALLPISTRLFKAMHLTLMSNEVRGSNRSPGEYRKIQNFIGPEGCTLETATFVPPQPQMVDNHMNNLEIYINDPQDELDELVRIAVIHAQFETIHPFLDGNGRIGRILIPLYLFNKKVIDFPNFFLSEALERDKHKYYRFLNDTRYKGDWNQWVQFFLQAMIHQADKNIRLIHDVNQLYEHDLELSQSLINSSGVKKLVDAMYQKPIFTVHTISAIADIPEGTCRRYLTALESSRIVFSDGKPRSKTYYYYNLLDKLR